MKHISLKKLTSLVLAVLMMASMLSMFAVGVSAAETKTYTKVTTAPADWSGEYLIVYEAGNVIFDGSRSTLDATSNTQPITITDNKITTDSAYSFTIAKYETGYSIKSASGMYIGRNVTKNGMDSSTDLTADLVNTITLDDNGVNIAGTQGNNLRYNATSGQTRFRYFGSTQKYIALYKLYENAGGGSEGEVTPPTCDHEYPTDPTSVDPATCMTEGTKSWKCNKCDDVKNETIQKLSTFGYHAFDGNGVCERCKMESPLIVGQTVYITYASETATYQMTGFSSNYIAQEEYTGTPGKFPLIVEAGATPSGADYTTVFLRTPTGTYLGYDVSSSKNAVFEMEKDTDNANNLDISWIPYVDENENFKLFNVATPSRELQYNASSPRFACYTTAQKPITIVPAVPRINNFSLTLDKSVTVNVSYFIPAEWLTANAGAKLYFYDGTTKTEVEAKAGENVYSITLTPGRINDALSFVLENNGTAVTTTDVSVATYSAKVNAAADTKLGLEQAQYDALVALLNAVDVYATAADSATAGELTNTFGSVIENTETGDLFTAIDGVLKDHASLNLAVDTAKLNDAYTVEVKLGEKVLVTGKLSDYIVGGKLVIDGIYAANFNETITVTVSNGTETVATATLSFNAYLSGVYTTASDAANKNMAVAAYNYGVAADALIAALATAA